MGLLLFIARLLFSSLFIQSGIGHLAAKDQMAGYAKSKGVPASETMVMLTGIMLLIGGLSILLGWMVNIGAWLLIIFLLPTAFVMHNYWAVEDPAERQNEQIHFMKDVALAGAAFLIWYLYRVVEHVPWSIS
jgi:uncharacterized membrane protein YphA (DoxX/SURF4 family)